MTAGRRREFVGPVANGLSRLFGRVEAFGAEHVLRRGPAIVAINHTTIADVPPVLSTLHHAGLRASEPCGHPDCGVGHGHVRFLASSLVFRNPVIGPLARNGGMIEVGGRSAAGAFAAALAALRRGEIIGIYPEGDALSPLPDGSPRDFRLGVGRLAVETAATVIPMAHHDAREIGSGSVPRALLGAMTSIVRQPTVRIRIGAPILPSAFAGCSAVEATKIVQRHVTELWESISSGRPG